MGAHEAFWVGVRTRVQSPSPTMGSEEIMSETAKHQKKKPGAVGMLLVIRKQTQKPTKC